MDSETLLELTKLLLEFLKEVGSSLATTAFQITAQKIIFDGIFSLFVAVILFLLLLLTLIWVKKSSKNTSSDEFGFAVCVTIILSLFTLPAIYMGVGRLVATEYYTVMKIVDLIK